MKKLSFSNTFLSVFFIGCITTANATPIAIGSSVAGPGDGLNAHWVDIDYRLSNVAGAVGALAGTDGTHIYNTINSIDFSQNGYNGVIAGYDSTPTGIGMDTWAVDLSGFLNVTTAGTYIFNSFTDDGFSVNLGGETIFDYNRNRAPGSTQVSVTLDAGFYDFQMIHWENYGVQTAELTWKLEGSSTWNMLDDEFFTTSPVPEPATMLLFGIGLVGLGVIKRKK